MKRISKPVFFIVAILIIAFACTAFVGIKYYDGDIQKTSIKGISDIRWGIDIRGGTDKPDVCLFRIEAGPGITHRAPRQGGRRAGGYREPDLPQSERRDRHGRLGSRFGFGWC